MWRDVNSFKVTLTTPKATYLKRLECRVLTVGRATNSLLRIDSAGISDNHLSFSCKVGVVYVEDHGSSQGTFIDGKRIEPHKLHPINDETLVYIGKTGISLSVATETKDVTLQERINSIPFSRSLPERRPIAEENTVFSRQNAASPELTPKPAEEAVIHANELEQPLMTPVSVEPQWIEENETTAKIVAVSSSNSGELLLETHIKASSILQEAEIAAKKKVDEIYRRAEETEAKATQTFQRKLHAAYEEAEKIYQRAQRQATDIMESARKTAHEIREQAESTIAERLRASELECERFLDEAQVTARKLHESKLAEVDAIVASREKEVIEKAQRKLEEDRAEFEREMKLEGEKTRLKVEADLASLRAEIATTAKERDQVVQRFNEEFDQLNRKAVAERALAEELTKKSAMHLEEIRELERKRDTILVHTRESEAKTQMAAAEFSRLQVENEKLRKENEAQEKTIAGQQEQKKRFIDEIKRIEGQVEEKKKEFGTQNARISEELSKLKEDLQRFQTQRNEQEKNLKEQENILRLQREEMERLVSAASEAHAKKEALHVELNALLASREDLNAKVELVKSKLAYLVGEENNVAKRLEAAIENQKVELLKLTEELEVNKIEMMKREQEHIEQAKLDMSRRLHDLERQLLEELMHKKARIAGEMTIAVERFYREHPEERGRTSKALQSQILHDLESQIVTLSKDPSASQKSASLIELKRMERLRLTVAGALAGGMIFWLGQSAYISFVTEGSPLERRVAAVEENRKQLLEQRKFNPIQSPEVRATYADSVIYTEGFAELFADDEFQKKYFKDLSAYMFKTWRLEEDKTIQIIATANSLVRELVSKKESIHPDFVAKGVEKMHELESEATKRMIALAGSEVRLESFRKRERELFKAYRQNRTTASAP